MKFQYQKEVSVKMKYQKERREEFQKWMNWIVRVGTAMQRSNLMLILYERKTNIKSVLISKYKNDNSFVEKMLM